MAMDKDQSIITQVAAKIAADLTIHNIDSEAFALKFMDIKEMLFEAIYGTANVDTVAQAIVTAFPGATEQGFTVAVKNEQQGPLPSWLIDACRKDGITEVYDNRGDLAANPRRPWFKAVKDKEKAYWPPKGA